MRARNIKPGFYKNEDLAECSLMARYIFPGLWMMADRAGRLEDRPRRIKGELLPFDNADVDALLSELDRWGLIKRYSVDGMRIIWIPGFSRNQNPHINERESQLPAHPEDEREEKNQCTVQVPEEYGASTVQASEEYGCTRADSLFSDSLIPDSLIPECSLREGEKSPDGDSSPTVSDDACESHGSPTSPELEEPAEQEDSASQPEQREDANGKKRGGMPPDCPHDAIIALYHEALPGLPRVEAWTETSRKTLRTRWREDKSRQCLDWWEKYFARVAASDFLCGRVKEFAANLLWLIGPRNMAKVLNGYYDNRGSPSTGSRLTDRNLAVGQAWLQSHSAGGTT